MSRRGQANADKVGAALVILSRVHPMLAGAGSDVQCVVLADLVATWIAGFAPADRVVAVERQSALVAELLASHDAGKADRE
jgi:hypothetical protein